MRDCPTQSGHTLIELMISLTLAMLISLAAMYLYSGQMLTFFHQARKQQASGEALAAFEAITTLLRQAEMCLTCATVQQIGINYPSGIPNPNSATALTLANDAIELDFSVPAGYPIWPNLSAPYVSNSIHLSWSQAGGILKLGNGTNAAAATAAAQGPAAIVIAGGSGRMNTRIANFDIWPLTTAGIGTNANVKPTAGYRVVMTARAGAQDPSYTNPIDPAGAMQHYRTVTYEAVILPRNW